MQYEQFNAGQNGGVGVIYCLTRFSFCDSIVTRGTSQVIKRRNRQQQDKLKKKLDNFTFSTFRENYVLVRLTTDLLQNSLRLYFLNLHLFSSNFTPFIC